MTLKFLLVLLVPLSSAVYAAPPIPDAGQTLREMQRQPVLDTPQTVTPLQAVPSVAVPVADHDARLLVKQIHVVGNTIFSSAELEALLADLLGGEHSLAELDIGAARISDYYHARGYILARAYLPEQDVKDGVLQMAVSEGRVDKLILKNTSRLSDARVQGYLSGVSGGEVLQAVPVDRLLLLLSDMPGVGTLRANLQPGEKAGTSDLAVELTPSAPVAGKVRFNNCGCRYTGEFRLSAEMVWNSPLQRGDHLSVNTLISDANQRYSRVGYQTPVGNSSFRLGGAYSDTSYRLGQEFAMLQAHGNATSRILFADYSWLRSANRNFSSRLSWEETTLLDFKDALAFITQNYVRTTNLSLNGNLQDALGKGGNTRFALAVTMGKLSMDKVSQAIDSVSANSEGAFTHWNANLNRLQRVSDVDVLSIVWSGQQANKNLHSAEKFSLGGPNGVRAYPHGEGTGDEGWMANLELRHNFTDKLQGLAFYDAGTVHINRHQYAAGSNIRALAGAGLGLNADWLGMQIEAALAWRTQGGAALAEPVTVNRNPRLWVQVARQF